MLHCWAPHSWRMALHTTHSFGFLLISHETEGQVWCIWAPSEWAIIPCITHILLSFNVIVYSILTFKYLKLKFKKHTTWPKKRTTWLCVMLLHTTHYIPNAISCSMLPAIKLTSNVCICLAKPPQMLFSQNWIKVSPFMLHINRFQFVL